MWADSKKTIGEHLRDYATQHATIIIIHKLGLPTNRGNLVGGFI